MLKKLFNIQHISAGFTAVLVGYTSSVVIIIQAATSAGATPEQIQSWLLALGVMMGILSITFSFVYKTPVLTAWSTPGAAFLVGVVPQYDLPVVMGAFVITGCLIVLTGCITPLSKLLERIPPQLGTAMLGAILLPFCLKAFHPVTTTPLIFLSMFISFLLAKRFTPRYAMLILLIVGIICAVSGGTFSHTHFAVAVATPVWMTPHFEVVAMMNIAIPLYIITMLSQNLPGLAVLQSHQYQVPLKPVLIGTGVANILFAPFGGYSANLAAISAAICMNKEVDTDPKQRYRAAIWAGVFYLIAGIWATTVVAIFLALPTEVSQMLAGFALLGTLLMCLQSSFKESYYQEPALITFLITLSGITVLGIGAILWGLLAGILLIQLKNRS